MSACALTSSSATRLLWHVRTSAQKHARTMSLSQLFLASASIAPFATGSLSIWARKRGLYTVISTNLTREELQKRYTERLTSRLLDPRTGMAIAFRGQDIRLTRP